MQFAKFCNENNFARSQIVQGANLFKVQSCAKCKIAQTAKLCNVKIIQNAKLCNMQNYAICKILQNAKLRKNQNYGNCRTMQYAKLCKMRNYQKCKIMQCANSWKCKALAFSEILIRDGIGRNFVKIPGSQDFSGRDQSKNLSQGFFKFFSSLKSQFFF